MPNHIILKLAFKHWLLKQVRNKTVICEIDTYNAHSSLIDGYNKMIMKFLR